MTSAIHPMMKSVVLGIIFSAGCFQRSEPSKSDENVNSENSFLSAEFASTVRFYHEEYETDKDNNGFEEEKCHSFRAVTSHFIDLHFENQTNGNWCCREVKGELLSVEFSENLLRVVHPFKMLEESVALPTSIRMFFPDDFPFLLRQAMIATVLPDYNIGVESVLRYGNNELKSDITTALSRHYRSDNSLLDHIEKIRIEYDAMFQNGYIPIHLLEDVGSHLLEIKRFNVENINEFLSVVNEMHEMMKGGKKIFLAWDFMTVKYFEDINLYDNSIAIE